MKDWRTITGIIGAVIITLALIFTESDKELIYAGIVLIGLLCGVSIIRKPPNNA